MVIGGGIQFDFAKGVVKEIPPNSYVLIVRDLIGFTNVFGGGYAIAGEYTSKLGRSDSIIVVGKNIVLQEFSYETTAPWPEANGWPYSLVIPDPAMANDPGKPDSWILSRVPTPGYSGSFPSPEPNGPGAVDGSYGAALEFQEYPLDVLALPDGEWLVFVGGSILKLDSKGVLDPSFSTPESSAYYTSAVRLPGGNFVVARVSIQDNGNTSIGELTQLRPDGSVVQSFTSSSHFRIDGYIGGLLVMADQSLIATGRFKAIAGTYEIQNIARILTDGTLDPSFGSAVAPRGADWTIVSSALTENQSIVIGCGFLRGLARLLADGSFDPSFVPAIAISPFPFILIQPDDKVLVYEFTDQGRRLLRLMPDGSVDPSFSVQAPPQISNLLLAPDGSIYASVPYLPGYRQVMRYFADGTPDLAFNSELLNGEVYEMQWLSPNNILIFGASEGHSWIKRMYAADPTSLRLESSIDLTSWSVEPDATINTESGVIELETRNGEIHSRYFRLRSATGASLLNVTRAAGKLSFRFDQPE